MPQEGLSQQEEPKAHSQTAAALIPRRAGGAPEDASCSQLPRCAGFLPQLPSETGISYPARRHWPPAPLSPQDGPDPLSPRACDKQCPVKTRYKNNLENNSQARAMGWLSF